MSIKVSPIWTFIAFTLAVSPISAAAPTQTTVEQDSIEKVRPESLVKLDKLVQGLIDDQEVVGAELLVIQDGKSLLHKGYGWRDREAKIKMETGGVFCVRSMTKPIIGASILMLIQEGKLRLDDKIADYLPAFDVEETRDITIEHLLTHTSGLPLSLLIDKNLSELSGIQAVAELGGGYDLLSKPGKHFHYSDQGTDTLTALIEVVSGMSASEFVSKRLLEPLGMKDSVCVMEEGHVLRERAISSYAGSKGEWTQFWNPDQPPFLPFFLGSQGLYSTTEDYARFMQLWNKDGLVDNQQLLNSQWVRQALTPSPLPFETSSGLADLKSDYGYLMQLWLKTQKDGSQKLAAFGHGGSDGTHAWVFPEHNAVVMYFTQSRGNITGLRVEAALGEVFFGVPFNLAVESAPPIEDFLGYYWEEEGDLYRAIIRDGEDMALEILGKALVPLDYEGDDLWRFRQNPNQKIQFDRSEDGAVSGYHIGEHQEFRVEHAEDLPDAREVAKEVAKTHRMDLLDSVGPIRLTETFSIEKLNIEGESTSTFAWPDRLKEEITIAGQFEHASFDGTDVWYHTTAVPLNKLDGVKAEQVRSSGPTIRFGDWNESYPSIKVIQKLKGPDGDVYIVRLGDTSATAPTVYVDATRHQVFREDRIIEVEMLGRIGQRSKFGDFREVSGMLIPFETQIEIAHPIVGFITSVKKVTETEVGIELPADAFQLKK